MKDPKSGNPTRSGGRPKTQNSSPVDAKARGYLLIRLHKRAPQHLRQSRERESPEQGLQQFLKTIATWLTYVCGAFGDWLFWRANSCCDFSEGRGKFIQWSQNLIATLFRTPASVIAWDSYTEQFHKAVSQGYSAGGWRHSYLKEWLLSAAKLFNPC